MASAETLQELFSLAIRGEQATEAVYRGLQARFAAYPAVARFFELYAAEEKAHALWLEQLQAALPPDKLAAAANAEMLRCARQVLQTAPTNLVEKIRNLEEAYQLVNELEASETNAICEFLIDGFSANAEAQVFLKTHLREHVAQVKARFPATFQTSESRLAVKANKQEIFSPKRPSP